MPNESSGAGGKAVSLPPMPEPIGVLGWDWQMWTADQMRAYGAECRRMALEEAAQAIETQETNGDHVGGWFELLAANVRALKDKQP